MDSPKLPKKGDLIEWIGLEYGTWFRLLEDVSPDIHSTPARVEQQGGSHYELGEIVGVVNIAYRWHLWRFVDTFAEYVRKTRRDAGLSK